MSGDLSNDVRGANTRQRGSGVTDAKQNASKGRCDVYVVHHTTGVLEATETYSDGQYPYGNVRVGTGYVAGTDQEQTR